MAVAGIVLIDKPSGITSFQALGPVKKRLGRGVKVGHTGTLDKFASGLLVVCIGAYTKLASIITNSEKSYEGSICFGKETETLDPEGKVIETAPLPDPERIEEAARAFLGEIEQAPPAYSALHINGERAYKRTLRGESLEMPLRRVTIKELAVQSVHLPEAEIFVTCSKGTYIRSLARDLARSVGSRGYLTRLRRVAVGFFQVTDAVRPDEFDPEHHLLTPAKTVSFLTGLDRATIGKNQALLLRDGIAPSLPAIDSLAEGRHLLLFTEDDTLAASLRREGGQIRFDFVNRDALLSPGEER